MPSGKARTRHHKGPQIGFQFQQPLKGSARILHAVNVVNFQMIGDPWREPRLVDAMLRIVGHRLGWHEEDGWLIHVVPETGNALLHEIPVQGSPPVARTLAREIW